MWRTLCNIIRNLLDYLTLTDVFSNNSNVKDKSENNIDNILVNEIK